MGVHLRKRKNADGTISFRLDISHNGVRTFESIKGLKLVKEKSLSDRANNKLNLELAKEICLKRAVRITSEEHDVKTSPNVLVLDWMKNYTDSYTKKDKRNLIGAMNKFKKYLGSRQLTFKQLDTLVIDGYLDFLEDVCKGEGARSYFFRFKRMIKRSYKEGMLKRNVFDNYDRKVKGQASKKDTLLIEELRTLKETPCSNLEIRDAAIFSAVTGLAWVDIKNLRWSNVKGDKINIVRAKGEKYNNTVVIPLNDTAMAILKKKKIGDLVFVLPSANAANKVLKGWVERAGIDKRITWHNLRHSFGTNLIYNKVDLLTTSKLLGHMSTQHTMRYVKASEELQREGTNKINL